MLDVIKQLVGVGAPPVERRLAWWVETFRFRTSQAVARLQAGEITIRQFREWGHQELKDTLYGIAETGAGRKLTRKEIYQARRTLKDQVGYWDRFCQAVAEQRKALAERGLTGDELKGAYNKLYAKFSRRAESYYGAIEAEGAAWAMAAQFKDGQWFLWDMNPLLENCETCIDRDGKVWQMKDGRLPFYPKDGSTICLYHCGCKWKPVLKPPSGKRKLGPMGARRRGRKLAEKLEGKKK